MKKTYIKPEMEVVLMKARTALLAGSGAVTGLGGSRSVGMSWDDDASDGEEGM